MKNIIVPIIIAIIHPQYSLSSDLVEDNELYSSSGYNDGRDEDGEYDDVYVETPT